MATSKIKLELIVQSQVNDGLVAPASLNNLTLQNRSISQAAPASHLTVALGPISITRTQGNTRLQSRPGRKSGLRPATAYLYEIIQHGERIFTVFPKLPLEIKGMVWKEASKAVRIIRIQHPKVATIYGVGRADPGKNLVVKDPVPAMLHVCREARKIGLKAYQLIPEGYCEDAFYINLDVDAILMRGGLEVKELCRNYDFWFPTTGNELIFQPKLALLILDPTLSTEAGTISKDPELFGKKDLRRLATTEIDSRTQIKVLQCFEKIIVLQPNRGAPEYVKKYFNMFLDRLWVDIAGLFIRFIWNRDASNNEDIFSWMKEGIKVWGAARFKERSEDGKWSDDQDCTNLLAW